MKRSASLPRAGDDRMARGAAVIGGGVRECERARACRSCGRTSSTTRSPAIDGGLSCHARRRKGVGDDDDAALGARHAPGKRERSPVRQR